MVSAIAGTRPEVRQRLAERFRTVDGPALRVLAEAGLTWLRTNQQIVNSLNVFPVPDGDTGTNMVLTMQSAWGEIEEGSERSIGKVCHRLAQGALMGARGNSGVILSQLWRGFSRTLDDLPVMEPALFVRALEVARDTAYKGVVRPVEGTILTVSKDVAAAAQQALQAGASSCLEILEQVVEAADASVQRTPELLPVLREAGVVDSGGMGLFFLFEGMLRSVYGQPLDKALASVQPLGELELEDALQAIEPGQDWEVVIDFRPAAVLDVQRFYQHLEQLGTSIQVGEGDGMYRMHIHVPEQTEYQPIEYVRGLGTITNIHLENLRIQVDGRADQGEIQDLRMAPVEPGQIAAIAVVPSRGIARVFASLGVAAVVEGGQTMNPSTQEILAAFEDLPTDRVVILPNNKNIIMTSRQAAELTVKRISVIPTRTVPQGIAALLALAPAGELEAVTEAMTRALTSVQTGELTVATRSVEIDGVAVKEGQVIGLLDGKLVVAGDDLTASTLDLLSQAETDKAELITLYHGAGLPGPLANRLADEIRKAYPRQEVELIEGGQPHYHVILSIE
jgi:DAK2 domain fusion protein YloV